MPKLADDVIDDRSDSDVEDIPATTSEGNDIDQQTNAMANKILKTDLKDAAGGEENGDEEEEGEEDVYEVESVVDHKFVKKDILYRVRWKGYDAEDDTWEPEDNLLPESRKILGNYHNSIGGRPQPDKKPAKRKSKPETPETSSQSPATKRSKRQSSSAQNGTTSNDGSPGLEDYDTWKPKESKWDDLIDEVETVERDENGNLRAYIRFKNGRRTKVNQNLYYQHCPRKMLGFYEKHLSV